MKIALLEPLGVSEETIMELAAPLKEAGHEFVYYGEKTTDVEELKARSQGAEVVMIANNPYPNEVIESQKALKMLAVAFTGVDHVGSAAKDKNVMICNCAGYSNQTVAELAVGMAIDVLRGVVSYDKAVRESRTSAGFMGSEICGKTVGIIGCGQIGFMTAKLFAAFGAKVYAYARHERDEVKAAGITYVTLETLLAESDIVSLHTPLNAETKGFFDANKIAQMKENAVFINCARGPIVDNAALAKALNEGKIAGAAIDVFDMEPPIPSDYPLLTAKNTLLTPHIAFASHESMLRRAKIEFANVCAYCEGHPQNIVK